MTRTVTNGAPTAAPEQTGPEAQQDAEAQIPSDLPPSHAQEMRSFRKRGRANEVTDPTTGSGHFANAKMRCQSFFMLTTVHPPGRAASSEALSGSA